MLLQACEQVQSLSCSFVVMTVDSIASNVSARRRGACAVLEACASLVPKAVKTFKNAVKNVVGPWYSDVRDHTKPGGRMDLCGPASASMRAVNALSPAECCETVEHWIKLGWLRPITLRATGKLRDGAPRVYNSHYTVNEPKTTNSSAVLLYVPSSVDGRLLAVGIRPGYTKKRFPAHLIYWRWKNQGELPSCYYYDLCVTL